MDPGTLTMLRSSLTHVLTEEGDAPLSERLASLGWEEVLEDDPASAIQALFEIRGTTLSGADALGPLLAGAIAESAQRPDLARATVILPSSLHPDRLSSRIEGAGLVAAGIAPAPPAGSIAIVPVGGATGLGLALVPEGATWSQHPLGGTDPSMALVAVAATVPASQCAWIDVDDATAAWSACASRARWALAAELVAIGHHVIGHAVDYTGQRRQYGRPIGTFQALQHRLAGAHASVVGASRVVAEAATSGSPWAALVAKAAAGRAAENACTQAQQCYGAIGFTWEHEFHRYLRRTYVLDWLFGGWRTLEREIGARLLDSRVVPRIGAL
jgi:acyl-CoA dehydrogenase-like protein